MKPIKIGIWSIKRNMVVRALVVESNYGYDCQITLRSGMVLRFPMSEKSYVMEGDLIDLSRATIINIEAPEEPPLGMIEYDVRDGKTTDVRDGKTTNETRGKVKEWRMFGKKELDRISEAVVVACRYGWACRITTKYGEATYIPMDPDANVVLGQVLDLTRARILTLERIGKPDTNSMAY